MNTPRASILQSKDRTLRPRYASALGVTNAPGGFAVDLFAVGAFPSIFVYSVSK
jgi:hypothetical protein